MNFEEYMKLKPYSLNMFYKDNYLCDVLKDLIIHHRDNCLEYRRLLNALNVNVNILDSLEKLPYIPVRLFKELELRSFDYNSLTKTLHSSGTTGMTPAKIYLDSVTERNQRKALINIVQDFIGNERLPMIILDCRSSVYTSRTTGITGFLPFGREVLFALKEDMSLDIESLKTYLEKYKEKRILLFGFTFIIYEYFYHGLLGLGEKIDLSNGILIHGGGWKKLQHMYVDNVTFKNQLKDICNLNNIHDFYGMIEQTGSIFMECEHGNLHSSVYSDIIIRKLSDFSPAKIGEEGCIEVLSILPHSYPGHILLTEDIGTIKGIDDCPCGRLGKYFTVKGRIRNAELRGCSDTYERKI